MLGTEALPAAIYLLMVFRVPESLAGWCCTTTMNSGQKLFWPASARKPGTDGEEIRSSAPESGSEPCSAGHLACQFYSPSCWRFSTRCPASISSSILRRVFSLAGLDNSSSLLSTAGVGVVNLIFTMLGLYLIDKAGRKSLMLVGSIGYIASLALRCLGIQFQGRRHDGGVLCVYVYRITRHRPGCSHLVFIAEIFPNSVRTRGQALGCGTHWVLAALITLVMPTLLTRFEPARYSCF